MHDDAMVCATCGRGEEGEGGGRQQRGVPGGRGALIACDGGCDRAFHLRCVGLRSVPVADWFCGDCSAAPTPEDEEGSEDEWRAQRTSQRRRAALRNLHQ